MQTPGMLRYNLNWKLISWFIVIGILILLVATLLIFQTHVDGIELQLDNLKQNESH